MTNLPPVNFNHLDMRFAICNMTICRPCIEWHKVEWRELNVQSLWWRLASFVHPLSMDITVALNFEDKHATFFSRFAPLQVRTGHCMGSTKVWLWLAHFFLEIFECVRGPKLIGLGENKPAIWSVEASKFWIFTYSVFYFRQVAEGIGDRDEMLLGLY